MSLEFPFAEPFLVLKVFKSASTATHSGNGLRDMGADDFLLLAKGAPDILLTRSVAQ
jgi:hypothetical protein